MVVHLARNTDTQVVGADSDVRGVDVSTNGWDDSVLRSLHERSMDGGVVDERSMGSSVVDQRSVGVDQGVGLSLSLTLRDRGHHRGAGVGFQGWEGVDEWSLDSS